MTDTLESLTQQLAQLTLQQARGQLPAAQYEADKAALERRILNHVMAGSSAPARTRPSARLLSGLVLGVLGIAVAGYLWTVTPMARQASADSAPTADGKAPQRTVTVEQIAAMTEKLAQRLQQKPDDVEGWTMLARSYSVLGRSADALQAYAKASSLRPDDPNLLADYADMLAVNHNGDLEGEPMKLVARALTLDPHHLKALYLDGTAAFNRKDYTGAIRSWEKLQAAGPAGNVFVTEVESAIAEARKLTGAVAVAGASTASAPVPAPMQAATASAPAPTSSAARTALATPAAPATPAASAAPSAPVGGATVSGMVTLSAALAKQARPDDTLFVFARAAQGPRMPLAILRKKVKDLPLRFQLDDSMAMSPAAKLSSASQVTVGARISKSGNAIPQPGDFSGQAGPVNLGTSTVALEIRDTLK